MFFSSPYEKTLFVIKLALASVGLNYRCKTDLQKNAVRHFFTPTDQKQPLTLFALPLQTTAMKRRPIHSGCLRLRTEAVIEPSVVNNLKIKSEITLIEITHLSFDQTLCVFLLC
jgi:hypothetical protein